MRKIITALVSALLFTPFIATHAEPQPKPNKTWTMLVYLNGNNSLDSYGARNIIDMEKVGSTDQVNIVVEWASERAKKTVRLFVVKGNNANKVTSPIIENLGQIDMGDHKTLEEFIAWGVKNYPADHYFIDVWDHGSGWHDLKKQLKPGSMGDISWDDNTGNSITTEQLGAVMTYAAKIIGHKVDIYGSDACLMAMGEVANEMKDSVAYSVGSEESEPGAGWPYGNLLKRWNSLPNATSEQVTKILVDAYVKAYKNKDDVTMSAFNLSKLPAYNKAIAELSNHLQSLNATGRKNVLASAQYTQRYAISDYADTQDFIKQLQAKHVKLDMNVVNHVNAAIGNLVIASATSYNSNRSTGISIWLPTSRYTYNDYTDRYAKMNFNLATGWNDALGWMLQGSN